MFNLEEPTVLHTVLERRDSRGRLTRLHENEDVSEFSSAMLHTVDIEDIPDTLPYGPWWFCVIKLSPGILDDLPMPFFIRRDDVEYGLRFSRKFGNWMTLNGIGCFHPCFQQRTPSALTTFLGIRNGLIVESLFNFNRMGIIFFRPHKCLMKKHYWLYAMRHAALKAYLAGPGVLERPLDPAYIAAEGERYTAEAASLRNRSKLMIRFIFTWAKRKIQRKKLARQWREAWPWLTSQEFWRGYLQLDRTESKTLF